MYELLCYDTDRQSISHFMQWDSGQKILIENIFDGLPFVHFCNRNSEKAIAVLTSATEDGYIEADVPNSLLLEPYPISVYVYLTRDDYKRTVLCCNIPVRQRKEPDGRLFKENINVVYLSELQAEVIALNKKITEAEANRQQSESIRNQNEIERQKALNDCLAAIEDCIAATQDANTSVSNCKQVISEANTAVAACNTATSDANIATESANSATEKANNAAKSCEEATTNAQNAAASVNSAIENCNQAITNANIVISDMNKIISDSTTIIDNCKKATNDANAATAKCNQAISDCETATAAINEIIRSLKDAAYCDVQNNLTTDTEGSVLDARQGKVLKELYDDLDALLLDNVSEEDINALFA